MQSARVALAACIAQRSAFRRVSTHFKDFTGCTPDQGGLLKIQTILQQFEELHIIRITNSNFRISPEYGQGLTLSKISK
jgi:hypothetical protein